MSPVTQPGGAPSARPGVAVSAHAERKDEHVRLAMSLHGPGKATPWADIGFLHHALPGTDVDAVDLSTWVLGGSWQVPFYVNAMTGGTESTGRLNAGLAEAAAAAGVAIASGSQHVALRDPSREDTFRVIRRTAPRAFVLANVGPTVAPRDALRAVEMLEADALQVHVNVAQEVPMPEGDRDFSDWAERIARITAAVGVPVVVKEVGFGLSRRTVVQLAHLGVAAADVAGNGGTDFVAIETARREDGAYRDLVGWGQSAALCLLECLHSPAGAVPVEVLTSGAVRTPLDVVRGLALGARAVGASGHFMRTLTESGPEALYRELVSWKEQVRGTMALLGASRVADLARTDLLVTGPTAERARLLGMDLAALARRSA
ncbi:MULTISPECIES: type 2 isopentenyl-diphosphate Delta-isomerase [unclassified Actinomyces]|uniref:type 2 isopentenyl-diphosphate Delta-isomerase n=1 Tax=unclassified Actinomyces TaxID=2609248 RepID=UPI0024B612E5|nr:MULTISPECIES: type 2 isopentenyl-diphosphate Delta-isomerase [unclassified Actinomyces]MCL3778576.1 type 2 isopentenyl-diphosphate Delta-isomerase [Actinomyces sp. AC-20-1]MCL3789601.1 type 2 isopentenyl-diphosphate Delta-isomerase [Actinomyces sp. 187325]MCL3792238.1 type 2 isopentenyl-diphosphate Delta-isomerase [Actinomyces sp. 186855]MCL3794532.1 type 2 isopentenyl-diphosphate Delta-isomerase [Actinomyces sp. 217892]